MRQVEETEQNDRNEGNNRKHDGIDDDRDAMSTGSIRRTPSSPPSTFRCCLEQFGIITVESWLSLSL